MFSKKVESEMNLSGVLKSGYVRAGIALVAFGVAALVGYTSANASDPSGQPGVTQESPGTGELPSKRFDIPTGVTADGRTYGSLSDTAFGKPEPDLIWVTGDAGRQGFADRRDVESLGGVSEPGDVDPFAKMETGELKVPVFEKDGTTQVDTFTIGAQRDGFKRVPAGDVAQ